jgi:hypothetical protein
MTRCCYLRLIVAGRVLTGRDPFRKSGTRVTIHVVAAGPLRGHYGVVQGVVSLASDQASRRRRDN